MPQPKSNKTHFSETEAARELGITIEEFRHLIRSHIVVQEEDLNNTRGAVYQASDLLVLKLLSGRPTASTAPR